MIAKEIAGSSADLRLALTGAGLPADDIEDDGLQFFRFSVDGRTVAYGGLEKHGSGVLLRSLVVLPSEQGRGFGREAAAWLLNEARTQGAESIFLLTASAAEYFARLGFRMVARAKAPEAIRATKQMVSLCPKSATLMTHNVQRIYNVLFLCTGNSARSILAESILLKEGKGRFHAYSAGSQPKGEVNPFALKVLRAMDYPAEGFRSKSWDEFAGPDAPAMDFVFTVCDNAAGETCPYWPGKPMTAHWGIEDPAAAGGTDIEKERAFSQAALFMKNRILAFVNLPLQTIDRLALGSKLRDIGNLDGATMKAG